MNLVSKAVNKALDGLNNPNKPYGVFLLNGLTVTGKTELSKQVAVAMNANFYRIDCSELSEAEIRLLKGSSVYLSKVFFQGVEFIIDRFVII